MGAVDDFRTFITRGNVVDLAVGVVIGLAFSAIVNALVTDIVTPLISIPGSHDLTGYSFTLGGGKFLYGAFLTAIISFILIALVVFFAIVRPVAQMEARRAARAPPAEVTTRDCPECLSKVPLKARRCAFCTSPLSPAA
ncbi:MAG TPA: large conductance mechanosensitive channel protein MscL [Thermoplasmata archaeon]|nr:large conductance mechanosensitive channel protein MscL [Thermoplasmata archaeon]HUJ77999.1 large conductance mechanosensitive channel protein MscL [Thermoplasmata archaeon]